ncbi:MAG: hypothetical protein ABSD58_03280 [Verrucomicrobiia bacterium]|jgi:hypothetical protein
MNVSDVTKTIDPQAFLSRLVEATSAKGVRDVLAILPIVGERDYTYDHSQPEHGWVEGRLHWYPVGGDRGNGGRIKHAGSPENPIAERTVNAFEAMIELHRQLELKTNPDLPPPASPREAVKRYFDLPQLDDLPGWSQPIRGRKALDYARDIARLSRVRLIRRTQPVEYTVLVEDDGIGQSPERVHTSILSLGASDKPDKPYLIGVFGQGGSSAFAASEYSWILSRRDPRILGGLSDGIGWTIIKRIFPIARRDDYWVYLAAHPDGRVPMLPGSAAPNVNLEHGTRIAHVNYNFGKTEPARTLYQSLNHLLFNPVLPYELYTKGASGPDPMWGNAYRLARLSEQKSLDKKFEPQPVGDKQDVE